MKRVDLARSGFSIWYEEAGDGPPLILLHGFLCDSRCWRSQLQGLSSQFRVVAWDAPGAGMSADPPEPFVMADWARILAEFFDALKIDRGCLLGLSWGGVLAQEFYRAHASRILALLLADTYAGWKGSLAPPAVEQRLARCLHDSSLPPDEFVPRWVPEMFTRAVSTSVIEEMSTIMSAFHPLGFRLMATTLAETDTTPLLPSITVPTLVLCGDDDQRSPLHIAKQLHAKIPRAEFAVVDHAGHLSNMEQPDAFNEHVRRFCSPACIG